MDSDPFISIATHAYGGLKKNSGSAIAGTYGNPYDLYIEALNNLTSYPVIKTDGDITYVSVPNMSQQELSFDDGYNVVAPFRNLEATAVRFTVVPFLGPIGGPVAALAIAVLASAVLAYT
jgi:hypothetical protein